MASPARIFLSHKTADKTIVRDYKATLEMVGLRPWLDEDELRAGVELHRALQHGMKDSCAAVFFITPSYQDEKFLRAEINYAVTEKTQRGDDLSIITLVLSADDGKAGVVPDLLEPYVWKQPSSHLQGFREIVRALPSPFRDIRPSAEVAAEPDVRVVVTVGQLVSMARRGGTPDAEDVVMVKLENHGDRPVFIGSGLSFQRDDSEQHFWIGTDATGAHLYKRTIAPGDGFTVTIPAASLEEHRHHVVRFSFPTRSAEGFRPTRKPQERRFVKNRLLSNRELLRTGCVLTHPDYRRRGCGTAVVSPLVVAARPSSRGGCCCTRPWKPTEARFRSR